MKRRRDPREALIPSVDMREQEAAAAPHPRWQLLLYAAAAGLGMAAGELILRAHGSGLL